jgi:hypothetical protein
MATVALYVSLFFGYDLIAVSTPSGNAVSPVRLRAAIVLLVARFLTLPAVVVACALSFAHA